jgi:hypothetical protein
MTMHHFIAGAVFTVLLSGTITAAGMYALYRLTLTRRSAYESPPCIAVLSQDASLATTAAAFFCLLPVVHGDSNTGRLTVWPINTDRCHRTSCTSPSVIELHKISMQ